MLPPQIIDEPTAGSRRLAPVDDVMRSAIVNGVFPGAVLLVSTGSRILFHKAYGLTNLDTGQKAALGTFYDLASLTKPLATALAVLKLVASGALELETRMGDVLPAFNRTDKAAIEIRHLLYHRAGFPDWRPYYRSISTLPLAQRPAALQDRLVREPLTYKIGTECIYSDLGFMVLHWLVETLSGDILDRFVQEQVYRPLGIRNLFYLPLDQSRPLLDFAATERCGWRKRLLVGTVHDENAYALGGVAGQSGLFGTAASVHQLLTALLDIYNQKSMDPLLPGKLLRHAFSRCEDGKRALGFDCPDATGSSSGSRFSENSVGHLGYTGTSFWMDLKRSIIVILLSNRVHPSRTNEAIKSFRPLLHNTIMSRLLDAH